MCDSLVVVREGEVLFAKNSDRDPNEAQLPTWVPAAEHPEGALVRCTWTVIPQARRTRAVLLSRPYWMWGAEMGTNDRGVVVGNEAVFARTLAPGESGLLGMDLVRLALERGESAAEAVEVLRALLAAHGQGGRAGYDDPRFRYHNSFVIADAREAFVVETVARELAVERVTRGARSISNGLTIAAFARRHADPVRGAVAACSVRRARTEGLGGDATSPRDLSDILRDHGEGRDRPRYQRLRGAMTGPCMHAGGLVAASQTTASWISRLTPARAEHWLTATAAPCLSVFRPVALETPLDFGAPTGVDDRRSLYWRFERLHRALLRDPAAGALWEPTRAALQERVWSGALGSREAHEAFSAAIDACLDELARRAPPADGRPAWLRRYWAARDRDARAAAPRLPAWRG